MIILCDMGGTHVRFAHIDKSRFAHITDLRFAHIDKSRFAHIDEKSEILNPQKLKIADYPSFDAALDDYLKGVGINRAEVSELRMALGNRNPWSHLAEQTRALCPQCRYSEINDFAANANGIALFPQSPLRVLRAGECEKVPPHATRVVIGPGTGTGLAYILDTPHGPYVQRTHGAHIAPAFLSTEHSELFAAVHTRRALSSQMIYEDILSGPGLWALYTEILDRGTGITSPIYTDTYDLILRGKNDEIAQQSIRIFLEIFGSFAAQSVAYGYGYGGVYLTGGVTDVLMSAGSFDLRHFLKFYDLDYVPIVKAHVAATPIYWVDDPFIALKGLL
ncbi:MAG: glucokinase [Alphaproteobacteria bacterium]|nr:glucokinase [Alphaproteobacteria bacterium]